MTQKTKCFQSYGPSTWTSKWITLWSEILHSGCTVKFLIREVIFRVITISKIFPDLWVGSETILIKLRMSKMEARLFPHGQFAYNSPNGQFSHGQLSFITTIHHICWDRFQPSNYIQREIRKIYIYIHRNNFLNLVELIQIYIVITLFRLIRHISNGILLGAMLMGKV